MRAAGLIAVLATTLLAFAGLGMTGHMAAHIGAVAVAAPVLALHRHAGPQSDGSMDMRHGGARHDAEVTDVHGSTAPLLLAALEFVTVWAWHAPALRDLADHRPAIALIEQAMFLAVGVALWRAAFAQPAAGAVALLVTSMHMTLLGALIALAPRPLYAMMAMHPAPGLDALADQQLGGVVMLLAGGASYCAGGLYLLAGILRQGAQA